MPEEAASRSASPSWSVPMVLFRKRMAAKSLR